MNEKQAKKIRKETRLYWQKYIARFASLPLLERVKMAFAIITLRSNTARTPTDGGLSASDSEEQERGRHIKKIVYNVSD